MYSSGSFEIFSSSCNTLGVSVDKLNSSIHSDYSCGGSDKGGGGGGPGGLVVLSSRDHIGHKEIEEEEGVAEEAAMAAHLFNDSGQLEEVDIPELFEVLAGGDTADEGTFKFLMEFAEDGGGSDAPAPSAAADTGTSTSASLSTAVETSTSTSGSTSTAPTELNEDIDLISSTDFESAFQSHQMLSSPATTGATPLPTTTQSLISLPSLVETMDTASSRTSPLQTPSSSSQQPLSTVQIQPATQALQLPSNSGNLLHGTSITLTKTVSTSNVSDVAAAAAAPQVWSLTQFHSVDYSKSRIAVKKSTFSTNAQSRFASVVVDGVLEPPDGVLVSL